MASCILCLSLGLYIFIRDNTSYPGGILVIYGGVGIMFIVCTYFITCFYDRFVLGEKSCLPFHNQ